MSNPNMGPQLRDRREAKIDEIVEPDFMVEVVHVGRSETTNQLAPEQIDSRQAETSYPQPETPAAGFNHETSPPVSSPVGTEALQAEAERVQRELSAKLDERARALMNDASPEQTEKLWSEILQLSSQRSQLERGIWPGGEQNRTQEADDKQPDIASDQQLEKTAVLADNEEKPLQQIASPIKSKIDSMLNGKQIQVNSYLEQVKSLPKQLGQSLQLAIREQVEAHKATLESGLDGFRKGLRIGSSLIQQTWRQAGAELNELRPVITQKSAEVQSWLREQKTTTGKLLQRQWDPDRWRQHIAYLASTKTGRIATAGLAFIALDLSAGHNAPPNEEIFRTRIATQELANSPAADTQFTPEVRQGERRKAQQETTIKQLNELAFPPEASKETATRGANEPNSRTGQSSINPGLSETDPNSQHRKPRQGSQFTSEKEANTTTEKQDSHQNEKSMEAIFRSASQLGRAATKPYLESLNLSDSNITQALETAQTVTRRIEQFTRDPAEFAQNVEVNLTPSSNDGEPNREKPPSSERNNRNNRKIPEFKFDWSNTPTSKEFRKKVRKISAELQPQNPNFADQLMTAMAFETGKTFDPAEPNKAGSGATGLIQFMPETAARLGVSTADLAEMTQVEQLNYVKKYFEPFEGQLDNLRDVYLAIFSPAYIGDGPGKVMYQTPSRAYYQNSGFDHNRDGQITVRETSQRVHQTREGYRRASQKARNN